MKLKKNLCALVLGVTCLSSAYVAFAADGVSVTGERYVCEWYYLSVLG